MVKKKKKEEVKKKLPATVRTCIYICVKKPVEKRFRGQTHSRYTAQITLMLFKKYIYIFMYIYMCVCKSNAEDRKRTPCGIKKRRFDCFFLSIK